MHDVGGQAVGREEATGAGGHPDQGGRVIGRVSRKTGSRRQLSKINTHHTHLYYFMLLLDSADGI